jgi:hypothetical protein
MSFPLPPVLLSEAGFYGDPGLWELGIYDEDDLRCFPREKLPIRFWALFASPSFFADIPPNLAQGPPQEAANLLAHGSAAPKSEPKNDKQLYYYARAKTQLCIDGELSFCETLAVVYARLQESLGEKIFLRGNVFLAKIAKAVFEQNGSLFAEACMKHKDEKYFRQCSEELVKLDFAVEKDKKVDKNSWLGLYDAVRLLASEYLATKCELPKLSAAECKENGNSPETLDIIVVPQSAGEADLKDAALAPLELEKDGLYDSSDHMAAGELFHEFIAGNFPFKEDESELACFMKGIYGEDIIEALGEFCEDAASGVFPRPEIKIDALAEEGTLGDHDGEAIYINQRLALDAISSGKASSGFVLLSAMLIEYGNFLGCVLREKSGSEGGAPEHEGRDFAYQFMDCSAADLFDSDFEFADFISRSALVTLEDKGKEQKLVVSVSGVSREQRKEAFCTSGSSSVWEGEA